MEEKTVNKNGFTLIELLVVIAILALVLSITIYSVTGVIKNVKEKTYKVTINEVEKAAIDYLNENSDDIFFIKNGSYEYQCVTVKELIDYGFLNKDVTKSQINDNGDTINANNYIYLERNIGTKTLEKNVYIIDSSYNNICLISANVGGNILIKANPVEWSRKKKVDIIYNVKNSSNTLNYKYGFEYGNDGEKIISYTTHDKQNMELTDIDREGTMYADIKYDDNIIVSNSKNISKFDGLGPIIKLINDEAKYVREMAIITLSIKDCESNNCSGLNDKILTSAKLNEIVKNNIIVKVGNNIIDANNINLIKNSASIYELKINNDEYSGKITIEIKENTFFDKVADEIKNGNTKTILEPKVLFDNTAPVVNYDTTTNYFVNSQTLKLTCSDENGITGYYIGTSKPNESTSYERVKNLNIFEKTSKISKAGTYYLSCKDVSNNITINEVKFFNYSFRYMLLNENGNKNTYNLSNYSQVGSDNTYLIANNSLLSQTIVEDKIRNNVPTGSNYENNYAGYSKVDASRHISSDDILLVSNKYNYEDFNIKNNYIYIFWFNRNILNIRYKVNSNEELVPGSYKSDVYTWNTNNGYVNRIKLSNNSSSIVFQSRIYSSGATNINLYNNSLTEYFAIKKDGYMPKENSEWKCVNGCKTQNMTFDQDEFSIDVNSKICDIRYNNCTIDLAVNWTLAPYNVNFNCTYNGGSGSVTKMSYVRGESVSLPQSGCTKSGWTFVGWNVNKDATTKLNNYTMPNSDVTLYAIYSKVLTVNYYGNGFTIFKPDGGSDTLSCDLSTNSCVSTCTIYNKQTSCSMNTPNIDEYSNKLFFSTNVDDYRAYTSSEHLYKNASFGCTISKDNTNWYVPNDYINGPRYNCQIYDNYTPFNNKHRTAIYYITTCNGLFCSYSSLNSIGAGSDFNLELKGNPNNSNPPWTVLRSDLSIEFGEGCEVSYYSIANLNCYPSIGSTDVVTTIPKCSIVTSYRTTKRKQADGKHNWYYLSEKKCYLDGANLQTPVPTGCEIQTISNDNAKVVLHVNGGSWLSGGNSNKTIYYNDRLYLTEFPKISRSGYKLDGWYVGSVGSSTIYRSWVDADSDNGKHLYAHWISNSSSSSYSYCYCPGSGYQLYNGRCYTSAGTYTSIGACKSVINGSGVKYGFCSKVGTGYTAWINTNFSPSKKCD